MTLATFPIPLDTAPMEARSAAALPQDGGWQFEPKWDGFRCLAFRDGDAVELKAKSGKSLTRYFPEVAGRMRALPQSRFVLDGELVIQAGGAYSFAALQMRLHPAESRIRRLAGETPAILVAFDCLLEGTAGSLLDAPLTKRRATLEGFHGAGLELTPFTRDRDEAQGWLDRLTANLDGVVCKRLDGPYEAGGRAMLKVKRLRTADCVVGGFRYESGSRLVGSLLLGLYNAEGKLDHVGYTSTITDAERPELTKRLEALIEAPGFTGDAPGGPSRWNTERSGDWQPLRSELVVEVRFDHVSGGRFRHGTRLLRWRPDKPCVNATRSSSGCERSVVVAGCDQQSGQQAEQGGRARRRVGLTLDHVRRVVENVLGHVDGLAIEVLHAARRLVDLAARLQTFVAKSAAECVLNPTDALLDGALDAIFVHGRCPRLQWVIPAERGAAKVVPAKPERRATSGILKP